MIVLSSISIYLFRSDDTSLTLTAHIVLYGNIALDLPLRNISSMDNQSRLNNQKFDRFPLAEVFLFTFSHIWSTFIERHQLV